MEDTSRYSTYSLTADRIPDWLSDEPFTFDDVLTPPSYLIASLQQAFDDYSYEQAPPTYDHSVGSSAGGSQHRASVACESIWDDEDDDDDDEGTEEGEASEAADDEDDEQELALESVRSTANFRHAGLWTFPISFDRISEGDEPAQTPTVSSPPQSGIPPSLSPASPKHYDLHSRPLPLPTRVPPPAYHLLHLQTVSRELMLDLSTSLAALDPQLLLDPFAAFADVCYEASVLGDTSLVPVRPFSSSQRRLRALPQVPEGPPSAAAQTAVEDEDDTDDDDDDDDESMPTSPAQTVNVFDSQPMIWDPKVEEHSRSRRDLPIRISRSISVPFFIPPKDELSSPLSENSRSAQTRYAQTDKMAEVAALFLRGPIQATASNTVHASPSRVGAKSAKRSRSQSRPRVTNGSTGVKGLFLRSLNISQPRWHTS